MKKVIFTLLAISYEGQAGHKINYLIYSKKLATEILEQTSHDVMITTNNVEFFDEFKDNPRVIVRGLPDDNVSVSCNGVFNYNLKHVCFFNIPADYDIVFYMDTDMKLEGPDGEYWDESCDQHLVDLFDVQGYDAIGTRTNAILADEIISWQERNAGLFFHKFPVYGLDFILSLGEDMINARTPSEHFFILKNDPEKINKVYEVWKLLNSKYEYNTHGNSAVHDGLEIGVSLKAAGYNIRHAGMSEHVMFKLKFNGNKDTV